MKTKTIILAAMLAFIGLNSSNATVITVSNHDITAGQYTDLQAAIDAAVVGDTIYVHGSATNYGNITINKRLTLLGTGHQPDKDFPFVSQISGLTLDTIAFTSGASGSKIIGFSISSISNIAGMNSIEIRRNKFGSISSATGCSNYVIANNVITSSISINDNSNWIIKNNIITNTVSSSNQPSVTFTNNVFQDVPGGAGAFNQIDFATINNNIFIGRTPYDVNSDNNSFNNNITYQTADDTIPYGSNTGSGNFVAINPLFVNVTGGTFSYSLDYNLQSGSPGIGAGTDSTDIGVFGGSSPFVDLTGSPAIPQMKIFNINNPIIPQNDSLDIYFKAIKQD